MQAALTALAHGTSPKTYRAKAINITGGTNKVQYSPRRTFVPNAEFVCHLAVDGAFGERVIAGFRSPVFTPYLGRMANPASFPFYLGQWIHEDDVLEVLPYVRRHDERRDGVPHRLRVHTVEGNYLTHDSSIEVVEPPEVENRDAQLAWIKEHLAR